MAADTRNGGTLRRGVDATRPLNQRGGTGHDIELIHTLNRHAFLELADRDDAPRVSIYLPTPRDSSPAARHIAWTNLVRDAERQVTGGHPVAGRVRRIFTLARRAVETHDTQARGLAYLAGARSSRTLSVAIDVPTIAVIGDRSYLRPLLPLLEQSDRYFVLGISRDDVRFFAGTRELVKELPLEGLPLAPLASMPREPPSAEVFVHDRGSTAIRGLWPGVGGIADAGDERRVVDHFRAVDAAVKEILRNSHAPLVLGGVGYLQAMYRGVNSYPALVPEGITGGLQGMTMMQLHERTWPMVEPRLHAQRSEALARFFQLQGSGRTVSEPMAAANAADDGRVETLVVAAVETSRNRGAGVATVPAHDVHTQMLLEQAIAGTLRHGGSIHVADGQSMPPSTTLAGILRY